MSAPLYLSPLDAVVQHFDHHVDGCDLCLVRGNSLCYEGRYLVDVAHETRVRAQRSRRPISSIFPSARRRPSMAAA